MINSILLRIAKTAILARFDDKYVLDEDTLVQNHPFLKKDAAVFVTLHYDKNLRGCIGSIIPHRSLLNDIIHNANSAAFKDPRFTPLSADEFSHLTLEVSLLSEPKLLQYSDYEDLLQKLNPNVDGLILKHGRFQGTFLPQVWEQLPTPKQFLEHLSMKAGSNPSIYKEHPTIYRYSVEAIEENFDEILPL